MKYFAHFVCNPRNIGELREPKISALLPYRVVQTIKLPNMDFENFYTDLLVERTYIGNVVHLCKSKTPLECVAVVSSGYAWGILVVPKCGGFVDMAAIISKSERPDLIKL